MNLNNKNQQQASTEINQTDLLFYQYRKQFLNIRIRHLNFKDQYQQLNIEISREITAELYFQNLKAKLEDSYFIPLIHQFIQKFLGHAWLELTQGLLEREKVIKIKKHQILEFLNFALLPKTKIDHQQRELPKEMVIEVNYRQIQGEIGNETLLVEVFTTKEIILKDIRVVALI
ncbi:hypothetical protein ABPG74_019299 [Tetrahymena malaccensis]